MYKNVNHAVVTNINNSTTLGHKYISTVLTARYEFDKEVVPNDRELVKLRIKGCDGEYGYSTLCRYLSEREGVFHSRGRRCPHIYYHHQGRKKTVTVSRSLADRILGRLAFDLKVEITSEAVPLEETFNLKSLDDFIRTGDYKIPKHKTETEPQQALS